MTRTTCRAPGSRGRRAVAAVLTVVGLLLVWAPVPPAAAHDELLYSDPSESGVLEVLPSRAILTFTGPVAEVHEVAVTGPDGSVANGAATLRGAEVRQNLWAGPDGAYTLTYDVVSADGHEVAGEIRFQVGAAVAAGEGAESASSPAASADGRPAAVVVPLAMVLVAGAGALLLWRRRRPAA
ncbi:copper resistance CopC family protein [Nocardioides hwasunensis]|uniref:Copper resistance protein CopC n=1 Tax=Nocardioides hwasunensis TaxID=397258 RepID=A0ABR8MB95_9ACTN|nr:copper resistance CopC family protein [Nocardioides hwasunensis]MBD3913223.1 copper resistance protein CopC [Nocardioides hwasunensis]